MPFTEVVASRSRTGRLYYDAGTNRYRICVTSAPLHYESVIDSGVFDTSIDTTPVRVNNLVFDGWLVNANGWQYALGKPLTGHFANQDGVVGFGGRKGQNWIRFKWVNTGYIHITDKTVDMLGAPSYSPRSSKLSSSVKTLTLPTGDVVNAESVAIWHNLYTPGTGEVYARWRTYGDELKSEYVVNAAARTWIAANHPPLTPASETWLGMQFELDLSDLSGAAGIFINNTKQDMTTDFSTAGRVDIKDSLGRLLAFMPLNYASVTQQVDTGRLDSQGKPIIEPVVTRKQLTTRFWSSGGINYLFIGMLVSDLNSLPPGDIVFDPTFSGAVGASTDDARQDFVGYSDTETTMQIGGNGGTTGDVGQGWRFFPTIPQGATVSAATISLKKSGTLWSQVNFRWTTIAEDNTATFSSGSPPGARAINSTHIAAENLDTNKIDGTVYAYPIDSTQAAIFASAVNDVVNRAGWVSGNGFGVVNQSKQDASCDGSFSRAGYYAYDNSAADAAVLDVTYTTSSGISGTLTATLGALSGTETGTVDIAGTESSNLSALSLSGTATLDVSAALGTTLGSLTLSSSSTLDLADVLSSSLGVLSGTETATVDLIGTLDQTLGLLTVAATGSSAATISGDLVASLGALVGVSAATEDIQATVAATLGALTGTESGISDISGLLSGGLLLPLTVVATGTTTLLGGETGQLGALFGVLAAGLQIQGALAGSFGALVVVTAGQAAVPASSTVEPDAIWYVDADDSLWETVVDENLWKAVSDENIWEVAI